MGALPRVELKRDQDFKAIQPDGGAWKKRKKTLLNSLKAKVGVVGTSRWVTWSKRKGGA